MIQQNIVYLAFKSIFFDTAKDIVRFPIWWYSIGLKRMWNVFMDSLKSGEKVLGISIWIKNIWRPMYGQYDWTGRIISFIVRVVQIIIRTILFVLWVVVSFLIVAIWVLLPLIVISQVVYQIGFPPFK